MVITAVSDVYEAHEVDFPAVSADRMVHGNLLPVDFQRHRIGKRQDGGILLLRTVIVILDVPVVRTEMEAEVTEIPVFPLDVRVIRRTFLIHGNHRRDAVAREFKQGKSGEHQDDSRVGQIKSDPFREVSGRSGKYQRTRHQDSAERQNRCHGDSPEVHGNSGGKQDGQDEKKQRDSEEETSDDGMDASFHGKALRSWNGIERIIFIITL